MDSRGNLLVRLHKWANRQDENFVSETFAFLMQFLIDEEPGAAANLLRRLTDNFFDLQTAEARSVTVRTQIMTGGGTPDLAFRTQDRLAYVEVKVESPAAAGQLSKYQQLLVQSGVADTRLILLTRHVIDLPPDVLAAIRHVRWFQVADWLEEEHRRYTFKAVSSFLVQQFLELLGAKGMTMGQVSFELAGGVRALRNFMNMLEESAHVAGVKVQAKAYPSESGLFLDGKNYWLGINYDYPDLLTFQTWNRPVDPDKAAALGVGEVHEWNNKKGHGWGRDLDLTADGVFFYARPRAGQMQVLEAFIRESIELARKVELPGDSAVQPNDPAEEDS